MLILKRVLLGDETAQASHLLWMCVRPRAETRIFFMMKSFTVVIAAAFIKRQDLVLLVLRGVEPWLSYTWASKTSADDNSTL